MNIIINMVVSLVVGVLFLQLLAWWVSRPKIDVAQEMESELLMEHLARSNELIRLLNTVREMDNLPSGEFSPEKQAIWNEYERLNKIDKELTEKAIESWLDARGGG